MHHLNKLTSSASVLKQLKLATFYFGAAMASFWLSTSTQANETEVHAASHQSCFTAVTLEPSFVAFTTTKHSTLAQWYKKVFGLKTVKEFSFPDGSVTGVLMNKDEFVVEVFNRSKALDGRDYQPRANAEQWLGVAKYGVYTNAELPSLKQCLIKQGVKAGRIYVDNNLGIHLLQVTDPEANVVEIISRFSIANN